MIDTNKHIVLTGATGFLGCYILRNLLRNGFKRITCTHRPGSQFTLIQDVKEKVNWIECDLTDELAIESLLVDVDAIIHAAARVSLSNKNLKSMLKTNVDATRLLADYALDAGVQKFVFVSSVASFGLGGDEEVINEETDWKDGDDNSHYALSKQLADREVLRAAAEGLDAVIVNPSMIIGAGIWSSSTVSLFTMVNKGLPFFPAGSIGIVDVRDVADLIVISLQTAGIKGQRFIVSAENWTHQRVIQKISEVLKKELPKKQLSGTMARLGMVAASIAEFFRGDQAILNASSIKMSQRPFSFDHSKSVQQFEFTYRSINDSINEIGNLYLKSQAESSDYAILDI